MSDGSIRVVGVVLLSCILAGPVMAAQVATKKMLTLEGAKRIAAAAEAEAIKNKWNVVIAIVDDAGNLVYLQRMDNVQTASLDIALRKACSAATFRRPTKAFEDQLVGGRTAILKLEGAMPFEGGVPIAVDGEVIGAVGVSGATAQQDGQVANAGVKALAKP